MAQQLLIIDGWEVPKITKYDVVYNKLWADDTGRDMSGDMKGTLIGIFPKITVEVGSFTRNEMRTFLSKVNKPKFNIRFYDEEKGLISANTSYYANDFNVSLKTSKRLMYKSFSFNLIPNKKR